MKRILLIAASAVLGLAGAAQAAIVQADFSETLDLPGPFSSGPRIESNTGVALPSGGPQLTAANIVSNPSGWGNSLEVSFDSTTNILSLTGDGGNDYTTISVDLTNLVFSDGKRVVGISPISVGNAVYYNNAPINLTESFTPSSFDVSYVAGGGVYPPDLFNIQGGTDTFQIVLGSSVPEPATWAMMLLGFGSIGAASRARRTLRTVAG